MRKKPRLALRKKLRDKRPGRWPDQFKLQVPAGTKMALETFADQVDRVNGSDIARELIELVLRVGPSKYRELLEGMRKLEQKPEEPKAAAQTVAA